MRIARFAPVLVLLFLAACGNSQHVKRPLGDVHASLISMPAEANAMALATTFPGTAYYLEPDGGRLVWHFTHNGKDYGRFVATLTEDGPAATHVSTSFETASDAPSAGNFDFLRKMARMAGEASIAAALAGRPVDRDTLQQKMTKLVASNPMAAHTAEIDRYAEEYKSDDTEPAYPKPGVGVYPKRGGEGGPPVERDPGTEVWKE
jgi:hypothetical protein